MAQEFSSVKTNHFFFIYINMNVFAFGFSLHKYGKNLSLAKTQQVSNMNFFPFRFSILYLCQKHFIKEMPFWIWILKPNTTGFYIF